MVSPAFARIVAPFTKNLKRLGIIAKIRTVDQSQYINRIRKFDFDMIVSSIRQSLSPGNEQRNFWSSEAADTNGSRNVIGIILSSFQSNASWERYQKEVQDAVKNSANGSLTVHYIKPWYKENGFVDAITDLIRSSCRDWGPERFKRANLILTAHAIPQVAAERSPYTTQFLATAKLIASKLDKDYETAYQSAPDNPSIPWTQPDIENLIKLKKGKNVGDIIVSPIGFLCDHVEVLYDLDIAANETAQSCGINMTRSGTVGNHPLFIEMLAGRIENILLNSEK